MLGAGVVGGVGALAGQGEGALGGRPSAGGMPQRVRRVKRVKRFGDAEIEQLDLPVSIHQHVAGLQVAVHQQVAMGMGHGIGQLQEKPQPCGQRQALHGSVHGLAVHILQHEVRQALIAGASVQQARDVGVAQARQCLALLRKTLQHGNAVHAALEQLDGRAALIAAVGTAGLENLPHAAGADCAHHFPGAQAFAGQHGRRRRFGQGGAGAFGHERRGAAISGGGSIVVGQQAAQLGQCVGVQRSVCNQGLALRQWRFGGGLEQGFDLGPAGSVGGQWHGTG